MTTELDVLTSDPSALPDVSDPVGYMATVLNRAVGWLKEAQSIDEVRNAKAIAVGYESVIREKEMAFDAQLSATEIVRRCERRIRELVRIGQESGEIKGRGAIGQTSGQLPRPVDDFFANNYEKEGIYAMTDGVSEEQFEEALQAAKAEGNLSRANVVRKVKPEKAAKPHLSVVPEPTEKPRNITPAEVDQIREMGSSGASSRQIASRLGRSEEVVREHAKRNNIEITADQFVLRTRRIDMNRVVGETVAHVEAAAMGLDVIDLSQVDPSLIEGWAHSLNASIIALTRLKKQLKEYNP